MENQAAQNRRQIILRLPTVKAESGLSRSTIYLRIAQRLWVKPVSLGSRAVGWPADEIEQMNAARIAGKSDDEIRELVEKLETARPRSFSEYNPNANPRLVEARAQFHEDVKNGKRPAPRSCQKSAGKASA